MFDKGMFGCLDDAASLRGISRASETLKSMAVTELVAWRLARIVQKTSTEPPEGLRNSRPTNSSGEMSSLQESLTKGENAPETLMLPDLKRFTSSRTSRKLLRKHSSNRYRAYLEFDASAESL